MTATTDSLYYDMFDREIYRDPYPVYRRLRDEAPLYENEQHGFFVVSRFEDVEQVLLDRMRFSSSMGSAYSFMPFVISGQVEIPSGLFIAQDAPEHTVHRGLVSRVFTPKAVSALEPQIRDFCARVLDDALGSGEIDYAREVSQIIPMRVIGMLLGIPEGDQSALRAYFHEAMNDHAYEEQGRDPFERLENSEDLFGPYIDWRASNPSDDLMTQLLEAEFEDATGTHRRLTRDEVFLYVNMIAAAGSDTTSRLMEWTAKLLAEHPDQRREIARDRSLIPNAIEEVLRFEPPAYSFGRYLLEDVELHGSVLPAGSVVIVIPGSANHDERHFVDPDRFDVHRDPSRILTFGIGAHLCIGASLARMEGRIVLEELLARVPDWDVDLSRAEMTTAVDTRGWESLPFIPG
jgi:cytochrome P450